MHQTNTTVVHLATQVPWADSALLAAAITLATVVAVIIAGVCVIVWLAIRKSRPQDRPAILDAVAHVLTALATVLNRSRR